MIGLGRGGVFMGLHSRMRLRLLMGPEIELGDEIPDGHGLKRR